MLAAITLSQFLQLGPKAHQEEKIVSSVIIFFTLFDKFIKRIKPITKNQIFRNTFSFHFLPKSAQGYSMYNIQQCIRNGKEKTK